MWTIFDKTGKEKAKVHQLEYNGAFMGKCYITFTIKSPFPIEFANGDYLIYRDEVFVLQYIPAKKKQARRNAYGEAFVYENIIFNSLGDELTRCDFIDIVLKDNKIHYTSLPNFSFYAASVQDFADRLQANLDRMYTGENKWTVLVAPGTVSKDLNFVANSIKCWDALVRVNKEWGLNFIIRGRTVTIGGKGSTLAHEFEYGKEKGLSLLEQTTNESDAIITRLRAYGSTKNLPAKYYATLIDPIIEIPISNYAYSFGEFNQVGFSFDIPNIGNIILNEKVTVIINGKTYIADFYGQLFSVLSESESEIRAIKTGTLVRIVDNIDVSKVPVKYKKASGSVVPNNMAVNNLMLPGFPDKTLDVYLDSPNIEEYGIREGTVFFDGSNSDLEEIFPSLEGMTAKQLIDAGISCDIDAGDNGNLDEIVSAEQMVDDGILPEEGSGEIQSTFTIILKDIGFDINDVLSTDTAQISMKSGMCIGRTFDITNCEKQGNKYVITAKREIDDSLNIAYPNADFQLSSGNRFVLLGIEMPVVYVKAASQRLLAESLVYLSLHDHTKFAYKPNIDNIFMARHPEIGSTIKEGDLFVFRDKDLNIEDIVSISNLVIKEGAELIPNYEIILNNEKEADIVERITEQVSKYLSVSGNSLSRTDIINLIRAVGGNTFLSKLHDDTASGHIYFENGITARLKDNSATLNGVLSSAILEDGDPLADSLNTQLIEDGEPLDGELPVSFPYLKGITGSGNGEVSFHREGLEAIIWNAAHSHAWSQISGRPTKLSDFKNDLAFPNLDLSSYYTKEDCNNEFATKNELSGYLKSQKFRGIGYRSTSLFAQTSLLSDADSTAFILVGGNNVSLNRVVGTTNELRIDVSIPQVDLSSYVRTDDSRLTDARPSSDVPSWAKEDDPPTYLGTELTLGKLDLVCQQDYQINASDTLTHAIFQTHCLASAAYYKSHVETADRLKDERTLWGNVFDGSRNIGGDLIFDAGSNGRHLEITKSGSIKLCSPSSGNWAMSVSAYGNEGKSQLGTVAGVYGSPNALSYTYYGGTFDNPFMAILGSGNIGMGTLTPSSKLDVIGTVTAGSFIVKNKSGFLKANGTVDTNTYLTSHAYRGIAYRPTAGLAQLSLLGSNDNTFLVLVGGDNVTLNKIKDTTNELKIDVDLSAYYTKKETNTTFATKDELGDYLTGITGSMVTTALGYTPPRVNNYLSGVSGSGNGTITFSRASLGALTFNAAHTHDYVPLSGGVTLTGTLEVQGPGIDADFFGVSAPSFMTNTSRAGKSTYGIFTDNGTWIGIGAKDANTLLIGRTYWNSAISTSTQIGLQLFGYVTAAGFKVGSSSGFLKANGTIDTNTYLTQHQSLADYVKTTDPRLSDARDAKNVHDWAKAATKPSYLGTELTLGNLDLNCQSGYIPRSGDTLTHAIFQTHCLATAALYAANGAVKRTGDTMRGHLYLTNAVNNHSWKAAVGASDGAANCAFLQGFKSDGSISGYILVGSDFKYSNTIATYNVLHSGNFNSYALPLSGGIVKGACRFEQGIYNMVFSTANAKYIRLCILTVGGTYVNTPLTFTLQGRSTTSCRDHISLKLTNSNTAALHRVESFWYTGDGAYGSKLKAYKIEESGATFEIWLEQTQSYDSFRVLNLSIPGGMNLAWSGMTSASLPTSYSSLNDCLLGKVTGAVDWDDLLNKPSGTDLTLGKLDLTCQQDYVIKASDSLTHAIFQTHCLATAAYGLADRGMKNFSLSGSGNAITGATFSGGTLTLTKGATYLTSHAYRGIAYRPTAGLAQSALLGGSNSEYLVLVGGDNVTLNKIKDTTNELRIDVSIPQVDLSGYYTIFESNDKFATKSQLSNYLTGITKAMVTTALGYTPPSADTNYYLSGVSGSGNGTITFSRSGLASLSFNSAHTHDYVPLSGGVILTGTLEVQGPGINADLFGLSAPSFMANTSRPGKSTYGIFTDNGTWIGIGAKDANTLLIGRTNWNSAISTSTQIGLQLSGYVTAAGFKVGSSSGFLKANGTVDTNTYLRQHQSLANYVSLNGVQTISSVKTFTSKLVMGRNMPVHFGNDAAYKGEIGYDYTNDVFLVASTQNKICFCCNAKSLDNFSNGYKTITGGVLEITNSGINVAGNITASGTISDARLKTNLQLLSNASGLLRSLGGVYTFNYTDQAHRLNEYLPEKDYGLIYQNVKRVLPGFTSTLSNGYGCVKYEKFIPLLLASQIEQLSEVDQLKREVQRLKFEIDVLRDRINIQ